MSTEKRTSKQDDAKAIFSNEGGSQKIAGAKPTVMKPKVEQDKSTDKKSNDSKEYMSKGQDSKNSYYGQRT